MNAGEDGCSILRLYPRPSCDEVGGRVATGTVLTVVYCVGISMLMLLLAVRLRREKPLSALSIYLVRIEGSSPSRICTTCGSLTARAAMPGATATRLFHRAALIPWPLGRMVGMRYALCCIFVPLCCAVCVACCEVQWMALTRAAVTIVYILPSSV